MLFGRESERRRIEGLLDSACAGRSAVLVLRGEAGIGKTALLQHAERCATGMTLLRAVGVEAEHELPFAGLHRLVGPCLGLLERLPAPQAAAVRAALGLSEETVSSRLLVSIGVLSLLAEACEDGPLLCVIDDAHWLDRPSQEALAFAARRLEAEPIAVVIAARVGESRSFDPAGLPEMEVTELPEQPARSLLRARLARAVPADVEATLLRAARGNPLALLELPAALSERQLRGEEPILGPPPLRAVVEEVFHDRVTRLPEGSRRALLLAAADDVGDLNALAQAIERSGLTLADLEVAERDGLVRLERTVEFRHPLVRSVAYRAATPRERRTAHRALAAVLDDPARRAWHRALVAGRADEAIAAELEAAAVQAAGRGAQASAAIAFERAAELSELPDRRGHRLRRAAQAWLEAGRSKPALALVERARPLVTDPVDAAALDGVRAADSFRRGSPEQTFRLLRQIATASAESAPQIALETITTMVTVAAQGGWAARGILEARRTFESIPGGGDRYELMRGFTDAVVALVEGDAAGAGRQFRATVELAERMEGDLLARAMASQICMNTGDFVRARDLTVRTIAEQRASGSLVQLSGTLPRLAFTESGTGHFRAGEQAAHEGLELAQHLGYENDETLLLAMHAWIAALLGREAECRRRAASALRHARARGIGLAAWLAQLALGTLDHGLGDARSALEHLERLDPGPIPPTVLMATPALIDAALQLGEPERAAAALQRFAAWAPVSLGPLVPGLMSRCRAILASDQDEAERLFVDALRHHEQFGTPYEIARTGLAYGERLRHDERKEEARRQLRTALDTFEGLGAALWARRARAELQAAGETIREAEPTMLAELTPRQLRIARLAAAGATNREIADQLFLSPKTVEYHLAKIFAKLGVGSRAELARLADRLRDRGTGDRGP